MKTSIDRFGRLLIPKQLRDNLGLRPGIKIVITEKNHELSIKPVESEPVFKRKNGVMVFTGHLDQQNLEDAVKESREKRLNDLASF